MLPPMLDPETQKLWESYLTAEKDRIRDVTMPALDRFIDSLLRLDPAVWQDWARNLAAQVSDEGSDIPVRFPLFRRVLLPALADGVLRDVPGCARSLAHFESHLVNTQDVPLPEHLHSAVGLLQAAVRSDPGDRLARSRLVERWGNYLDYTLHELPDGVLYGHNGATPEQCGELLELLRDFRSHVAVLNREEEFAELIADCDLHFNSYREYLARRQPDESYESFLETRQT